MSLLIRNALHQGRERDIYIEDGRIREIGSISVEADEVIDAENMALLPGFINTHTHAAMTLFRGWGDDMQLMDWLSKRIWPMEAHLDEKLVYWGTKLACLEMIRTGTTTFMDMYFHPGSAAKAVSEMGIRGYISSVFLDKITGQGTEQCINTAKKEIKALEGIGPTVYPALGPHAVYSCSKEILEWVAVYSGEKEIPVHFHLLETEAEKIDFHRENGMEATEYLEKIEFLQPRLTAAHCVWADERDIERLSKHGVNVSYNPVSNMKLAVGKVMDIPRMEEQGINISLGTDGPASNNTLSMLDTMKFAGLSAKNHFNDPTLCSAESLLKYASYNGAKALSLDCGIIEEGKLADILLVGLKHESMVPRRHSLYSKMAYSASPEAIRYVISNGKTVMRDRVVKDSSEIIKGFERTVNNWFEKYGND